MMTRCMLVAMGAAAICGGEVVIQNLPDGAIIMSRAPVTGTVVRATIVTATTPSSAAAATTPPVSAAIKASAATLTVYRVNEGGVRSMMPSRVVERDVERGDVRVYDTDVAGNKKYIPRAVVENGTKAGELKVYNVDQGGVKDVAPSRVVEKDAESGAVKIYNTDIAGNKQALPTTVVEKDESGTLKVYKVESGVKQPQPCKVVEQDKTTGEIKVYDTDQAGNKQFIPVKIIEALPSGSGTSADETAIDAATGGN